MNSKIIFFDTEVSLSDKTVLDIGAINDFNDEKFHLNNFNMFYDFCDGTEFICGHNIIHHDLQYLDKSFIQQYKKIDTLYLSPLLFPTKPYHRLVKDDKLQVEELNNPLNDSEKARILFYEEVDAFLKLSSNKKKIFCRLLFQFPEFTGFFNYVGFRPYIFDLSLSIFEEFSGYICESVDMDGLIKNYPVELAYALALIGSKDFQSILPPWLLYNYPKIENVLKLLTNTPCSQGCKFCKKIFNVHLGLKSFFGYSEFRKYDNEPLQENATKAAVQGKSLLAVFPTGGGKSITFQLPALMSGRVSRSLTIVISPLQSLMKDQVDNLAEKGIDCAVTINGMMDPIQRANSIERVANGQASLLYISPEQLRSKTIEKLLLGRNIARFVIDEAHCFSAWGHDFRVDYLYIGDFIKKLQKQKQLGNQSIPVSCFTATAKQKVITDICDYFKKKLDLDLEIFASTATRENLHYTVLYKETDEDKYNTLRMLISNKKCPTIVYASRTKRTFEIAEKLQKDGFKALPFNGKMEANDKIANQEAFMNNEVSIIVATSAFGMGVDKSDVKLVIHYDISDSLENYIQEAGRAGRDPSLNADCYVLFNDNDLDKHFIMLNQTKLSLSEIQQVWKAVKDLTKSRPNICCSALEIARAAGWDDSAGSEMETRVKTALSTLETAGYITRGNNVPRVYATSIRAKDMMEASTQIRTSPLFDDNQKEIAVRIIKSLISSRSIALAGNADAESRVDYISDKLGISKESVIDSINLMKQDGLLEDSNDMSAYIYDGDNQHKSNIILERFAKLESFIISKLSEDNMGFSFKELNEDAQNNGITTSNIKNIKTILYFLGIKNYIQKQENKDNCLLSIIAPFTNDSLKEKFEKRIDICKFILNTLYKKSYKKDNDIRVVEFSLVGLFNKYQSQIRMNIFNTPTTIKDIEDALLYLTKIGSLKIEGGFLVLYNRMEIKRLIADNRIKYKVEDYRLLDEFYKQKIQQIHIVGEYANLMVRDYKAALQFVQDYFNMDFKKFISKYFKGHRSKEIEINITPKKYKQIFGELSEKQSEIINDSESKYIVVAAGPGSGKTKVLVHKLASLLLLEDVKHEQLLMVTFSRAAATEFKKRLISLIGNAANFVEIKTFHSYCFDLLGKIGTLEASSNVVRDAAEMIKNGEVEQGKITKSVLVIDEAQDMDENEFSLIKALMSINEEMRVVAVGDDDQNIYEFRGSNSDYMKEMINYYGATKYEMTDNYRSKKNLVSLTNSFVSKITNRLKTLDVDAFDKKDGILRIINYNSSNMELGVVENLIENKFTGKTCILTNTNDECLTLVGTLNQYSVCLKLIQSLDGFNLYNILELREFCDDIIKKTNTPIISNDIWKNAKSSLISKYKTSTALPNILRLISDFETTRSVKYLSDFKEFINESKYEDFVDDGESGVVYVSTIHKSKGREFDNIYLMLKDTTGNSNEELRKIYVGLTRAKSNLIIHINTKLFNYHEGLNVEKIKNDKVYGEPKHIMLQLTHRDVVLDYFKTKNKLMKYLRTGMELSVENEYLIANFNNGRCPVAKFSKSFVEKLNKLYEKGYKTKSANIRFMVYWKGENDTDETLIILSDLSLEQGL